METTIAAIGTALGEGGIGIVRLSGPASETIIEKLFVPANKLKWKNRETHKLYLGNFKKSIDDTVPIDQVLVTIMKSPNSFTGENMAEIHTHGGLVIVNLVLEALLKMGATLAEPGEFTRRAFLNGKLDLIQAEASLDLIRADNEAGLKLAASQLEGSLGKKINLFIEELIEIIAYFEAEIDFPEEKIDALSPTEIEARIKRLQKEIEVLLKGFNQGKILKDGLNTIIFGKPNVGKSTLLNMLVGKERAIVTEIPGTTRDLIIEKIEMGGVPLKLIDTAGIRLTEDLVEKIGIERTEQVLAEGDLALLVLDGGSELSEDDYLVFDLVKKLQIPFIVLLNKIDLENQLLDENELKTILKGENFLEISALTGVGLIELENKIKDIFNLREIKHGQEPILTRIRHAEQIKSAVTHLKEALTAFQAGLPEDFILIDLKEALTALAGITGELTEEDVLDKIFAEFCIGK